MCLSAPGRVAHDELHGDVVVVRVDVAGEVRQVAVRERLLALRRGALDHLPADRPAVAVGIEVAGVLLRLHDVGGDAPVEVCEPVLAQDFLKGWTQGVKVLENLRPVDEMGHGAPGERLGRPDQQHDDRSQADQQH